MNLTYPLYVDGLDDSVLMDGLATDLGFLHPVNRTVKILYFI